MVDIFYFILENWPPLYNKINSNCDKNDNDNNNFNNNSNNNSNNNNNSRCKRLIG